MDKRQFRVWDCQIGIVGDCKLPSGADSPMRQAVQRAFREITGRDADFCFSGWGGCLTDIQKEIVLEERNQNDDT